MRFAVIFISNGLRPLMMPAHPCAGPVPVIYRRELVSIYKHLSMGCLRQENSKCDWLQACRYLVIDFGTSKSPKSTRQRDNHYCPDRPASVPLRQHPRTLDAGFAALPQMTGRYFSYAYFVFPLRYRTPDKQCGPGRYRGLTAFASLSMAVSVSRFFKGSCACSATSRANKAPDRNAQKLTLKPCCSS